MKKTIKVVNEKAGILQVTTNDERWYAIPDKDVNTGLPTYRYIPSVTWICGHYPKGIAFYKWLADKGWDESQAIKQAAGEKGSKIHQALELLIAGKKIKHDDQLFNTTTEELEGMTLEEWEAVLSFAEWVKEVKPKFLLTEQTVISEKYGFAGTVDTVIQIGDQVYIVDFKSSQYVWPEYELQIAAYKQALSEMGRNTKDAKLAILQIGYKKNRRRYKFTEVEDKFDLFKSCMLIWRNEADKQEPLQKDYPISISIEEYVERPKDEPEPEKEVERNKEEAGTETTKQVGTTSIGRVEATDEHSSQREKVIGRNEAKDKSEKTRSKKS